jgi:arylsulfatase A-like enzyme
MSKRRPASAVLAALFAVAALVAAGLTLPGTAQARPAAGPSYNKGSGPSYVHGNDNGHGQPQPSVTVNPIVGKRTQPNIVVIMTDDARDDDLRFMPNVQRLIEQQGVRFINGFSPQPLCCPARASFVTGQYSHNHHVWSNADPWGFHALNDKQTIATWLKSAGYNTVMLGKYLNGYGMQTTHWGGPSMRYVPPGWTDWRAAVEARLGHSPLSGGTYRYFDTTLNVNGTLQPHQGRYQTFVFARQSMQIFREYARSPHPFFFWDSFVAPHHGMPHEADDPSPAVEANGNTKEFHTAARPRRIWGRFNSAVPHGPGWRGEQNVSDKPFYIRDLPPMNSADERAVTQITRERGESLSVVDHEVKKMVAVLKQTGELDNTYIVFLSDNGYFLGEHRMRQGKILPYEVSLRVPIMVRGPGIPKGQVRTDPFTLIDFAPTFLQMAGAPRAKIIDGVGMLNIAKHGDQGWNRGILTETGPRYVRDGISESDNFLRKKNGPSPLRFTQGIRTRDYLYTEVATGWRELYDLRTDPGELTNLVHRKSKQKLVKELAHQLALLRNCKGLQCSRPLPPMLRSR